MWSSTDNRTLVNPMAGVSFSLSWVKDLFFFLNYIAECNFAVYQFHPGVSRLRAGEGSQVGCAQPGAAQLYLMWLYF